LQDDGLRSSHAYIIVQRQHLQRSQRQHARRPRHYPRRLQYRPDHFSRWLPRRRAPLPTHLKANWARSLDPNPDLRLLFHLSNAVLPQRQSLLPRHQIFDRYVPGRLHTRHDLVLELLLHGYETADSFGLVLDVFATGRYWCRLCGRWTTVDARYLRLRRMALDVPHRGSVHFLDRTHVVLPDASKPGQDQELALSERVLQ